LGEVRRNLVGTLRPVNHGPPAATETP